MSYYIANTKKLTVGQLIEEMHLGESVERMGLSEHRLNIVPTHTTGSSGSAFFGMSQVHAYFYVELAFRDHITQAQRDSTFHSADGFLKSNRHNSPLVFGIPTKSQYSGYTLGYQG